MIWNNVSENLDFVFDELEFKFTDKQKLDIWNILIKHLYDTQHDDYWYHVYYNEFDYRDNTHKVLRDYVFSAYPALNEIVFEDDPKNHDWFIDELCYNFRFKYYHYLFRPLDKLGLYSFVQKYDFKANEFLEIIKDNPQDIRNKKSAVYKKLQTFLMVIYPNSYKRILDEMAKALKI